VNDRRKLRPPGTLAGGEGLSRVAPEDPEDGAGARQDRRDSPEGQRGGEEGHHLPVGRAVIGVGELQGVRGERPPLPVCPQLSQERVEAGQIRTVERRHPGVEVNAIAAGVFA
jgi:hypothetical protein